MKTERNILVAFLLNLCFSIFEMFGGIFTGSVAILSDSIHDLGDAMSIGISWMFEKKSKKQPNEVYTYGYSRYSVIGSVITTTVLLVGSALVIYNSIRRIITPVPINYDGMIAIGIFGVVINSAAAFFTREGDSLNQKAVNLHMLEDVLGWIIVLAGAVIMRFTDISLIDPIMSIAVSIYILIHAVGNLKECVDIFTEKIPDNMDVLEITDHLGELECVDDVHHLHLWSLDGQNNYATLHVVSEHDPKAVKKAVRQELEEHGICHVTIEIEGKDEYCEDEHCHVETHATAAHHHHHH